VFAGGGVATTNNYDVALSGGIDYAKGLNLRSFVGVEIFYQQFSLLYDNEINSQKHATGSEGEIIMHKTAYAFIAPKFRFCLGRRQNNHFYMSAGLGMNMGGYDSLRRFQTISTPSGMVRIDTTLDKSKNINSMLLRVGVGATQHLSMGRHWRFTFTEDKTEIKNRMVKQFQASQSGITENKLDGRGKIKLARYFVYAEVYDFSVSEDETINLKDGIKNKVVTRLGLQIKFVDAETGEYFTGSGLGDAKTVRELTLMNDDNFGEIKFNQSTIGTTTKKALEDASAKILTRMIKKKIFIK
jgi:hypothetical protein